MDFEAVLKSTVLEALIEKVTNIRNKSINNAAVEALIKTVRNEPDSVKEAIRLLTFKIQSPNEWEALQSLYLLEACMASNCDLFLVEIGKFRFLNELIKLVSTKYLGNSTPLQIKTKIIDLLKNWAHRYPKETKIKEAYDMLLKQGVVENGERLDQCNLTYTAATSFEKAAQYEEDDVQSKMLQKLLKSNKPDDLKAANSLIKTMVKEKEEKEYLRLVWNNVKLLSEMLLSINADSSREDIELIRELKDSCVNMKPTVFYLLSYYDSTKNSKALRETADLFELNDLLNDTLQQYQEKMQTLRSTQSAPNPTTSNLNRTVNSPSLLDFSPPTDDVSLMSLSQPSHTFVTPKPNDNLLTSSRKESAVDTLEEIFSCPCPILSETNSEKLIESNHDTSMRLFEDLNVLNKSLLQAQPAVANCLSSDMTKLVLSNDATCDTRTSVSSDDDLLSEDDDLVNGHDANSIKIDKLSQKVKDGISPIAQISNSVLPISDIFVPLIDIKTEENAKVKALGEMNGINVSIQLTKNRPRDDIAVFLILTQSKRTEAITNFTFQPIIPKDCRLKLQPLSKCDLPPFNPHIPIETIVQIMLIASVNKVHIPLKFVISYNIQGEMISELGEVIALPLS